MLDPGPKPVPEAEPKCTTVPECTTVPVPLRQNAAAPVLAPIPQHLVRKLRKDVSRTLPFD